MTIYRIIDANINRVSEGLRILEDISRFIRNDSYLSRELRNMRHRVRKSYTTPQLLKFRDSNGDIGLNISRESNIDKKEDISNLIEANFKRVQEGLRSIEESLKILGLREQSKSYEALRFISYTLEKEFIIKKSLPNTDIYGILGEEISNNKNNIEIVKEMIKANIKIIQYREKSKAKLDKYQECKIIRKLTEPKGITFIINDDLDIALSIKADGIHIGQDDLPIVQVKKLAGNMLVGVSTHNENQAKEAVQRGADYIGVGPIYKTSTKKDLEKSQGLQYLEWVSKNISIPYVAIGGIRESNILEVKRHGGNTFAMISEIIGAKDLKDKVQSIRDKLKVQSMNTSKG